MKKVLSIVLALLIIIPAAFIAVPETEAREAFDINKHYVEMDVQKDGVITITETLDVTFFEQRHGIYVNIPKTYEMTWEINGQTIQKQYQFPVRGAKCLSGHKTSKDENSNYLQLRFGSSNSYAEYHEVYKWTYDIVTRDLDLDGLQMLFMNLETGRWNTDVKSLEFIIRMPEAFDRKDLWFDSPQGVTNESGDVLSFVVSGNTISGTYNEVLKNGQAVTVQLLLPDNYFTFVKPDTFALTGTVVAGILAVASAIVFFLFGKDDPLIETVEFHAPAGTNSAEVGVIIDGIANDGDVVSLILDWGRRGIITIEDTEDDLILKKRNELEDTARDYEHIMFNKLFAGREEVRVSSLRDRFYKTISSTEEKLDKYFNTRERRLITQESEIAQIITTVLSFLPVAVATFLMIYNMTYDTAFGLLIVAIEAACIICATGLLVYMDDRKYVHKWYIKLLSWVGVAIMYSIAGVLLISSMVGYGASPVYAIAVICFNIVVIIAAKYMKKRTEYGNQLLGEVLGLRNFIIVAEQDRLQELVNENPYYFYDILPFAYALGLTDVWNEHFKNLTIEPCDWYYCPGYRYNSSYHMINSLESQMTSIERAMTSMPESSSSGGGSIGGGGGGGFSGGGFGGSSGGSW